MSNDSVRGRFVWYELLTSDPRAAQDFYTRLIDWGTQAFEGGAEPYTMWTNRGQPIGGVMRLPEEARKAGVPPHWLAYVGTPNVDDTVAQAQKLGASVKVPPTDIPKAGRFAVLADPQGAVFGVYSSASPTPSPGPPQVGDVSWHELVTTDYEAALRFYAALFGWEKREVHDMGPIGKYVIYGLGDTVLGGMFNKPADMPAPPNFTLYVRVDDVHPLAGKVKELGGQILNGPMEVPGGDHIVVCMDPQGAAFALHSVAKKS